MLDRTRTRLGSTLPVGLMPGSRLTIGAWGIHIVLILLAKILVDAIPGMTQDVGWTVVNLGYMAASFLMFHHVTGVPFET